MCFANNCGKAFLDSWPLRKHTLTHAEKYYICPECGKEFADNSKLRRHFLVHSLIFYFRVKRNLSVNFVVKSFD